MAYDKVLKYCNKRINYFLIAISYDRCFHILRNKIAKNLKIFVKVDEIRS